MNLVRLIMFLNAAVFLMWLTQGESKFMMDNFLVSWDALHDGRWWVLITSVFSHNMFLHIFINMFVFRDFGGYLVRVLGARFFLIFYLFAGAFSSLCHAVVSVVLLHNPALPALGASGAISGLLLLFCLLFPKEKILILGIIPVPALFGALAFIGLDLWGLSAQAQGGGLPIGHGAHLGGAVAGIMTYFLFLRDRFRPLKVSYRRVQ